MHMLYDSDSFVVLHLQPETEATSPILLSDGRTPAPVMPRNGFEIVDKRSGKEVYLDGAWAELFQLHIEAWQQHAPSEEEVEEILDRYAVLAQNPVLVH